MDTLVVLSALVCVIIAAPALPKEDFEDLASTTWSPLVTLLREKKSPQQNTDFNKLSDMGTSSTHGQDMEPTLPMGRSLGFKKPIIVKKKIGYHLYRNSDEEKELSTSRESCNEKVKVKLCDENLMPNSVSMKSSTNEDINDHSMSEDEMKRSLIMAKEAIANLERDLKKMDAKQDMNLAGMKNDIPAIDETVHKDIDAARQALQHIHDNFGNLESLRFHGTTLKDAEEIHDIHVTVAQSEEERITQWKEAMENIQRNIDIARNIEDSFRNPASSLSLEESGTSENNINEHLEENNLNKLRNKDDLQSTTENALHEDIQCSSQVIKIKPKGQGAKENENLEDDTNASATLINKNEAEVGDKNFMRSDHSENNHNEQKSQFSMTLPSENMNTRNTELDMSKIHQSDTEFQQDQSMNTKSIDEKFIQEKSTPNNNFQTDRDLETAGSVNEMKSTDTRLTQARRDLHELQDKEENNFVTEQRNAVSGIKKDKKVEDTFQQEQQLTETLKNIENTDSKKKLMENSKLNHFQGKSQQIDKSDQTIEHNEQSFTTDFNTKQSKTSSGMNSAVIFNSNPQQSNDPITAQWSPERTTNFDKSFKSENLEEAEDMNNRKEIITATRSNNPTQSMDTMRASNHFGGTRHQMHLDHSNKHHDHHIHHGMSRNGSPNRSIMNMRDATVNFGSDKNVFHWSPSHDNARSAYGPAMGPGSISTGTGSGSGPGPGSGPASGTNEVGLFPNANVGACSIPLLLSCAPSVTSGSLAKALPAGYGASAYRTDDDLTFFPNKRETKKPNEFPSITSNKISTKKQINIDH